MTFSLATLTFAILTMICLGVSPFGTLYASCTWKFISFFGFRKFLAIIYSNSFLIPFPLFFWNSYYAHFILSHRSHMLFPLSLSAVLIMQFPFFNLIHHSGVLLCNLVSYSLPLDCFLSQKWNYLLLTGTSL